MALHRVSPGPRAVVLAAVALSIGVCGLCAPSTATASTTGHHRSGHHRDGGTVTLARGITLRHRYMQSDGMSEQVTLLGVDLTKPGTGIDSASPQGAVGAERATVRAQTNARHAIAGVNADFFSLDNESAAPRGVLVTSGTMLKSPTTERNANLIVRTTRTGPKVSVGALPFDAQVTRVRAGTSKRVRPLTSVNSLVNARAGGLTLLTSSLLPSVLGRPCALATGKISKGVWTVGSVRTNALVTPTITATTWGLLSCSGHGRSWIRSTLRSGDRVTVDDAITGGTPYAAVSGGSVLVKKGRAWNDPDGEILPFDGRNAETFVCVAESGRQLTLGTIDGYTRQSAGVTYDELTRYMLSLKNCWSGLVLDGGGSSTLVARMPGTHHATVQNVPADHPPRHVADTLVVFGH